MNPLRILVICHELPPVGGGGGNVALELAKEYSKENNVTIITSRYRGQEKIEQINNLTIRRVRCFRNSLHTGGYLNMGFFIFSAFLPAVKICKNNAVQVLHCHFGIPGGVLGYLINYFLKIPYIITGHGSDIPGHDERVKIFFSIFGKFIDRVYLNASAITVVSKKLKELLNSKYPNKEITVFNNAVSTEYWKRKDEYEVALPLTISYVGRFSPEKNPHLLIDASEELIKFGTRVKIMMIGDGPEMASMKEEVNKKNISEHVTFTGWIQHEELKAYLNKTHILVHTSHIDALPTTSILQAMSMSIPIICVDIPGSKDLFHSEMIILNDPSDLASKIYNLSQNSRTLVAIANESRINAENHSWASSATKYLDILKTSLTVTSKP